MIKGRIGIITSGGDAPGMNPVIRYLTRGLLEKDYEVIGFRNGYSGVYKREFTRLEYDDVAGILKFGGTILGTSRFPGFKTDVSIREKTAQNLKNLDIEALIIVGGEGSAKGALALEELGVNVILLPASIDNDIYGTDECLGMDTAMSTIVESVDKIKDTASSHDRAFIIEVMGHKFGYLALSAAIVTGAEGVFIPEIKTDVDELSKRLRKRYMEGRKNSIIIVAEGSASGYEIRDLLAGHDIGYEMRVSVLGYTQRGGSPTFRDRFLAYLLATGSIKAVTGKQYGTMVGVNNGKTVFVPISDVVSNRKKLPFELLSGVETLKWED